MDKVSIFFLKALSDYICYSREKAGEGGGLGGRSVEDMSRSVLPFGTCSGIGAE